MKNKNNYYFELNGTRINLSKHKEFHEFLPNDIVLEEHIKAQIIFFKNEKLKNPELQFKLESMELTVNKVKFELLCSLLIRKSCQFKFSYLKEYASLNIYNSKFRFSVLKIIKEND